MKKVIIAFTAGQALQLTIHAVALNLWNHQQIPFCAAGGFLVLVALIAGAWGSLWTEPTVERETYIQHARVPEPGEAKIANIFGRKAAKEIEDMDEVDELPKEITVTNTGIRRTE